MTNLLITIILCIIIYWVVVQIQNYENSIYSSDHFCNLENFDIDKIHIIKRDEDYQKLINKLIDEKRFIFTDEEIKILKNKFQIYNITPTDIQNITKIIMLNCKNNLNTLENNNKLTPEEYEDVKYNILNNFEYDRILGNFSQEEKTFNDLNCSNTNFLKCNNQENYYYDLYGNNIISNTKQYMSNYYSTINSTDKEFCVPVTTVRKIKPSGYNINQLPLTDQPYFSNNFDIQPLNEKYTDYIIPIQYNNDIEQTNIYNIDNSRVINPYSIY
jgi:hypothetical protein